MKIESFTDLDIWKLSRTQSNKIYELISREEFSKDWALKNQINRSSGSVMDNIAEGFGRTGNQEFANFLFIANGSNTEVQSQLHRAFDRGYMSDEELKSLLEESRVIHRKIIALIKHLKQSHYKGFRHNK